MQFSEHENAAGLRVLDFNKAEKSLNRVSYGHKYNNFPECFRPIPGSEGLSVVDEGPEIDLRVTLASNEVSELVVEDVDPTLFVHYATYSDDLTEQLDLGVQDNSTLERDQLALMGSEQQEDILEETENVEMEEPEGSESEKKQEGSETESGTIVNGTSSNDDEDEDESESDDDIQSEVDDMVLDLHESGHIVRCSELENDDDEVDQNENSGFYISVEWLEYMKLLEESFLNSTKQRTGTEYDELSEKAAKKSFRLLLKDLRKHGANPVLNVMCDFFRDYFRGPATSAGLKSALSVIDAFGMCPSKPNTLQVT
jgi:hypothetical protein